MQNNQQSFATIDPMGYNGNPSVKRDGVQQKFTEHEISEYLKCMKDPEYFARTYVKVISLDHGLVPFKPYEYQGKMFRHFNENRFSIVLACRQSGKCITGETVISVRFLDACAEQIQISWILDIFASINRLQNVLLSTPESIGEQIYQNLLDVNTLSAECFDRMWRKASYSAKESWWHRLSRKSSNVDGKRTLYSTPLIDQNVFREQHRKKIDDYSILDDGSYQKQRKNFDEQIIRNYESSVSPSPIDKQYWRGQPILREISWKQSSERDARETSYRKNIRSNISIEQREMVRSDMERRNAKNQGTIVQSKSASPNHEGTKTIRRDEVKNRRGFKDCSKKWILEQWASPFGRNETEDVQCRKGKTKIGRNKTEIESGGSKSGLVDSNMSSLFGNRVRTQYDQVSFHELQKTEKFVESYEDITANTFSIDTDTGWKPIKQVHRTIPFVKWTITTQSHNLCCADTHIVFDENYKEKFIKDLTVGDFIQTNNGLEAIESITTDTKSVDMYDLGVDDTNHRYYTNGVLSHNSISSVIYLLWFALFSPDKTIAILANKAATAREMLARATLILENLPFFLQPGCRALNKGSIEFSNNSRIIAAATSGSSIRGLSCVAGNTKICIEDDNTNIFYVEITKLINKSEFAEVKSMFYIVYKITNKVNGKIYVGFHKTSDIEDGYMGSGTLIKKAIEKYGIEAFRKEIIQTFDNQADAEKLEADIVNKDFTLREDTYNLALGGNVRIMYRENNPFFGKTHTEETRKKISEKHLGKSGHSEHKACIYGTILNNLSEIAAKLQIVENARNNVLYALGNPANNKDMYFLDANIQNAAFKYFTRRNETNDTKKQILSTLAKDRFTGVAKTEEHKKHISEALTGIKRENLQNKDLAKIEKTAAKHRGMKRSNIAKEKMSLAKRGKPAANIGKKYFRNPETREGNYFVPGTEPMGWLRGTGSRK